MESFAGSVGNQSPGSSPSRNLSMRVKSPPAKRWKCNPSNPARHRDGEDVVLSPALMCSSPPMTPMAKRKQNDAGKRSVSMQRNNSKQLAGSGISIMDQVVGALLGSSIAEVLVYPLDTVKLLQQAHGLGTLEICRNLMETQGFAGFFRGMPGRLFQTVMTNGMFFFFQSLFKKNYKSIGMGMSSSLLLNMFAQQCNRVLTTPLDVAANIHQIDPKSQGFLHTLLRIAREEGMPGLWKGLGVSLILSSNPALMFTLVDKITSAFQKFKGRGKRRRDDMISAAEMFFISGTAKFVATLITYPLIRAKTLQQTAGGASASLMATLRTLIKSEGYKGMYTGVWVMSWKTVLFNALMMAIKQNALRYWKQIPGKSTAFGEVAKNPQDGANNIARWDLEILGDETLYESDKVVVYIDGGWSYLHPSHQHMLAEAQNYGDILIVGVHDEAIRREIGDKFAERYENRLSRIRQVRGVDAILHHAPYSITHELIQDFKISKVLSGFRTDNLCSQLDPYYVPKQLGIYHSLADPYSGMWRNIVRVMFSNVDTTEMQEDVTELTQLTQEGYMTQNIFRSHSTGHFTIERSNSFYFYHDSSDNATKPAFMTRRGRHLAQAQNRRDVNRCEYDELVRARHELEDQKTEAERKEAEGDFDNFVLSPPYSPDDTTTIDASPITSRSAEKDLDSKVDPQPYSPDSGSIHIR